MEFFPSLQFRPRSIPLVPEKPEASYLMAPTGRSSPYEPMKREEEKSVRLMCSIRTRCLWDVRGIWSK